MRLVFRMAPRLQPGESRVLDSASCRSGTDGICLSLAGLNKDDVKLSRDRIDHALVHLGVGRSVVGVWGTVNAPPPWPPRVIAAGSRRPDRLLKAFHRLRPLLVELARQRDDFLGGGHPFTPLRLFLFRPSQPAVYGYWHARRAKPDSGLPRLATRRRDRLLQSRALMVGRPNARPLAARRGRPIGPDDASGRHSGKGARVEAPRRSIHDLSNSDRSVWRRLLLLIGLIGL